MRIKKALISITAISSILITGCSPSQKEVSSTSKHKTIHHETHKQISSNTITTPTSKKNTDTLNKTPSNANDNFYQIVITDDSKGWALSNKKVFKKDQNKWVDVTPPSVKIISIDAALQLYALNENLVWVTYRDNIFKSRDGGA